MKRYDSYWAAVLLIAGGILLVASNCDALDDYGKVPRDLVEKAAKYYAERRWPGCRLISSTPYYALDGSVDAWAVQFAKSGSNIASPEEIAMQAFTASERLEYVRAMRPLMRVTDAIGEKDVSAGEPQNPPLAALVRLRFLASSIVASLIARRRVGLFGIICSHYHLASDSSGDGRLDQRPTTSICPSDNQPSNSCRPARSL